MNRISSLFGVRYPIIQGGMIWCSGWELASAVSNAGGLGLIGSGSMYPEVLRDHIRKCKQATDKPFGVNLPLLYSQTEDHIQVILDEGVKIVFTSAGNPSKYTAFLKEHGITVAHVVANKKFALKAVQAGVDALIVEGFEAGGHDGFEETTTLVLTPMIREIVDIPLISAGGIASGKAMFAAMALGADGVQVGSAFAVSKESSAHYSFKEKIVEADDGSTKLMMKKLVPVRLLRNSFFDEVQEAEDRGADKDELSALLGKGRAKKGMFEGDTEQGELEIGQVAGLINEMKPVKQIVDEMMADFHETSNRMEQIRKEI
ncbi:MAG: nitronate monooxygenase [Bacteroidales bacterium]|nr:nitronate monooxygenase [Bacteroidales bacterium]